ncbi:MAG: histidinol-phosphate transaminase [Bdellovibrionales bacterium]|nr:histidinol-phosphate transaminase [Bdellovibrionales bacterium]
MTFTNAPEYIRNLAPYVPGKPIEETQREFKIKHVVKLASNENPLGPSPKALALLRKKILDLHRYPDASAYHLKLALAETLKLPVNEIIIGNGSNEVIDMLIRAYCVPGDSIVTSKAAFLAYRICAQIQGVATLETALTPDLRTDLRDMAEAVRANDRVKMVFIANPNNPTGTYNTSSELKAFLKEMKKIRDGSVMVVFDYAYWEYVNAPDLPDPNQLMREYPNMTVLRTFSKIHGLAGLRVGYGVAPREIVQNLEKVRQPFNLNSPALAAAVESLKDVAHQKRSKKVNDAGMKFWTKELDRMGIPYWPSQGNFILIDCSKGLGKRGGDVYENCLRRGVIFRPVSNYGLMHALRISIGTKAENEIAIRALAAELPEDRRAAYFRKSGKKPMKRATASKAGRR